MKSDWAKTMQTGLNIGAFDIRERGMRNEGGGGRRELFAWPPTVHFMLQSVPSDFHKATLHFLISFSEKERQA